MGIIVKQCQTKDKFNLNQGKDTLFQKSIVDFSTGTWESKIKIMKFCKVKTNITADMELFFPQKHSPQIVK